MPAPNDRRGGHRFAKAQRAQRRQRAGIVVGTGEDQVAAGPGQARRLLEQPRVVAFDAMQRGQQRVLERHRIGIAQESRDGCNAGLVGRHAMGLLVVDHLQAMLDLAQEAVGLDQLIGGTGRNMAGGGQCPQCLTGATQPERRIATAKDQLLGLGKEFDLPNAAAPQLDVVAQDLDRTATAMGSSGRAAFSFQRVHATSRRSVSCGRGR